MLCHVATISCSSNTFPWQRASSDQSSVNAPTLAHVRTSLMLHHGKFSLVLNTVTAEKCTWTQREEGFIHRLWQRECPKEDCLVLLKVQIQGLKTTALWSTWSAPVKTTKTHHSESTGQCWSRLFTSEKKSLSLHLRRTQFDRSWL